MTLYPRLMMAAAALLLAPSAPAHAADYDPPVISAQPDQIVPVEIGSGWYLRGDIGYTFANRAGSVAFRTFDPLGATYGAGAFDTTSLASSATFGAGFGYTFNEWFRADATLDGFRSDFGGTTVSAAPCPGGPAGTSCRSEETAELSTLSLLLNGYVDLGTYVGLTPYVGAGAGISQVSWSNLDSGTYCVDGAATCAAPALVGTDTHTGNKSYRFTWALMAGLAYAISPNLKVDLGYKYTNVAGGDMFDWNAADTAAGATGIQGSDDGFSNHQIRLGLRYELW